MIRRLVVALLALAALVAPSRALAEQVTLLPFAGGAQATSRELEAAHDAAKAAVLARGFTLASDSQILSATMASKDGVADTTTEYRAAGRASGSQWVLGGHVEPRARARQEEKGEGYRLELEACQVDSGRVESLAREIEPSAATGQVGEMLALLLRPEGIANADIPWERAKSPAPLASPAPTPAPAPPPAAPRPAAPKRAYAEGHPFSLGAGARVNSAVSRPSNAMGPREAALVEGSAGYALEKLPGLELRAAVAGAVAGPGSVVADAGARFALPLAPAARLFAGPEVALGALFPTGGNTTARFYARGSLVVALGLGERVQVEIGPDASIAPGADAALVFLGGSARGLVRF